MVDKSEGFLGWVEEMVVEHSTWLAGVARSEGIEGEEALDATQEAFRTFLTLPQSRSLVGHPVDTRAVLAALVRNAARNLRRKRQRHASRVSAHDEALQLAASSLPSAAELIARAEEHVRALGCIEQLATVQRDVVTLRLLDGASGKEAASVLGLTPGNVAVILHRAKQSLLECMGE